MDLDNQIDFILAKFDFELTRKFLFILGVKTTIESLAIEAAHCLKMTVENKEDYEHLNFEGVYLEIPDFMKNGNQPHKVPMLELRFVIQKCNALSYIVPGENIKDNPKNLKWSDQGQDVNQ